MSDMKKTVERHEQIVAQIYERHDGDKAPAVDTGGAGVLKPKV